MILFHVTHRSFIHSIVREGLSPAYAKGKLPVVWLVSEHLVPWALLHIQQRDSARLTELIVLEVAMPQVAAKRFGGGGRWTCDQVIPVENIISRTSGEDWGWGQDPDEQRAFDAEAQNLNDARG